MKHRMPSTLVLLFVFLWTTPLVAETFPLPSADAPNVYRALWHCFLFGVLGIIMVIVGFKLFDWLIAKIDLETEIAKGNIAAAIISAAAIIGISVIIAAAIH